MQAKKSVRHTRPETKGGRGSGEDFRGKDKGNGGGRANEGPATTTQRYGVVLLLIVAAYILCATQANPRSNTPIVLLQLATAGLIFRVAGVGKILRRIANTALGAAAILALTAWITGVQGPGLDIALSAAAMILYALTPPLIIRQQIIRWKVDKQTLLAAISAYLLIGMFFTFFFNLVGLILPSGIFASPADNTLSSQVFFSFTSLTTTGYGNLVPADPLGQTAAIAEAIMGQLFLVVAVASVVSALVPSRRQPQEDNAP